MLSTVNWRQNSLLRLPKVFHKMTWPNMCRYSKHCHIFHYNFSWMPYLSLWCCRPASLSNTQPVKWDRVMHVFSYFLLECVKAHFYTEPIYPNTFPPFESSLTFCIVTAAWLFFHSRQVRQGKLKCGRCNDMHMKLKILYGSQLNYSIQMVWYCPCKT